MRSRGEESCQARRMTEEYRELFGAVSALLFRHDPIGINFEGNADEYDSETGTILPRLKDCRSVQDVQTVVHEEFVRWFDRQTAGPPESYSDISAEIWKLWNEHNRGDA